jgi:hypothetical protein
MRTTPNQAKAVDAALVCAVLAAALICGSHAAVAAEARPTYDRRIEEAAIRNLQPKLGAIRGSLDLTERNHLFPPLSRRLLDSGGAEWPMPNGPQQTSGSIIRY